MKLAMQAQIPPIEKCAAGASDVRETLHEPFLDARRGRLMATDGQVLAVLPVAVEPSDCDGPVPAAALVAARKAKAAAVEAPLDVVRLPDGSEFPRATLEREFPHVDRIMPLTEQFDIAFNAADLVRLAKVLCHAGRGQQLRVKLAFGRADNGTIDARLPVKVRAADDDCNDGGVGLLMPVRFGDKGRSGGAA